jgi:uncharacterized protein YecE (DUF72 family)
MGAIRVGVAGWDYRDWMGIVYPTPLPSGFDRLAYLCGFVDVLEVNSTFYRAADPGTASTWVRRTARHPGFRFTAKAHRSWTHERDPDFSTAVPETLRGLEPLRAAGALGALLIQFPQRFHHGPEALERLRRLLDDTQGWPVVVELRHASWARDEAVELLAERKVGLCVVDQPRLRDTVAPEQRVTGPVSYLRLHGRNAADWFREGAGRDARYDYLYSTRELTALAAVARGLAHGSEELFVVQNNHFRGQAVVNAIQMKHLLSGGRPPAPAELVRAYPSLADVVTEEQSRLF